MRDKVIGALLILNLFASMLVYRGMEVLVGRMDRLECRDPVHSGLSRAPTRGDMAQQGLHAPDRGRVAVESTPATESPPVKGDAPQAEQEVFEHMEDRTLPAKDAQDTAAQEQSDADAMMAGDIEGLKNQYETQYSDATWTAQVHQAIQKVAESSMSYSGITQDLVECKEKVCKLAIGYSDNAVFEDFVSHLGTSFKGELASVSLYFDEPKTVGGNARVDIYLVRQ